MKQNPKNVCIIQTKNHLKKKKKEKCVLQNQMSLLPDKVNKNITRERYKGIIAKTELNLCIVVIKLFNKIQMKIKLLKGNYTAKYFIRTPIKITLSKTKCF